MPLLIFPMTAPTPKVQKITGLGLGVLQATCRCVAKHAR